MSLKGAASSGGAPVFTAFAWLCACTVLGVQPGPAHGQNVLLFKGEAGARVSTRRVELQAALGPLESAVAARDGASGPLPARLEALRALEELLVQARAQTAALAEPEALASLAEAARYGERLGDVAGAALWNAELQLRIGVTAAQAGMTALAREAFRRAATLEAGRELLAAEAPPAAVALYEDAKQQVAIAATGVVGVQVNAERAEVYLDDVPQGRAPLSLRAPVGRHLLRVEAPGHRTYGSFIDVLEGARPPLRIALAPEPERLAAQALERAAHTGDYAGVASAARSLNQAGGELDAVWVMELAARGPRALLVRCDAAGCLGPVRVNGRAARESLPSAALEPDRLARDRDWLLASPAGEPALDRRSSALNRESTAWWERWYVWGGVALAVGAAAVALAVELAPPRERQLQVVLEP